MNKYIIILTMFFLTLGLSFTPSDASAEIVENNTDEISIIGVKMDAEWCGKCKVMNPKLDNIMPEFKDEDILFVKFNMTNDFTTQQAGKLAERMNLPSLFEENRGSTGYMVLVNAETGEVLHTLQSDQSEEDLIRDIRSVLEAVQA